MTSRGRLLFVTFLTFVRFPLVILFFAGAIIHVEERPVWLFALSLAFLALAAVSDLLDGYFARKFDVVTEFGAHADPLMDKFFYLATLPLLVFIATRNGHLAHAVLLLVMTLLFLSRDQWVTFLRSIGAMYDVSGKARWSGKLRTAVTLPLICIVYFYEASPLRIVPAVLMYAMECAAIVINLVSVYTYTRDYWPSLRKSAVAVPAEPGKP